MIEGIGFIAGFDLAVQTVYRHIHQAQARVIFNLLLTVKGHGVVGGHPFSVDKIAGLYKHTAAAAGGIKKYTGLRLDDSYAPAPQQSAPTGWDCPACGCKNIQSRFCPDCGGKKPEPKPANGWDCPNCGCKNITSKFCPDCGSKKPEANAGWDCPDCGCKNITSKFCPECGAKKPEAPKGWICPDCGEKDIMSKFCPNCGRKKDE